MMEEKECLLTILLCLVAQLLRKPFHNIKVMLNKLANHKIVSASAKTKGEVH